MKDKFKIIEVMVLNSGNFTNSLLSFNERGIFQCTFNNSIIQYLILLIHCSPSNILTISGL